MSLLFPGWNLPSQWGNELAGCVLEQRKGNEIPFLPELKPNHVEVARALEQSAHGEDLVRGLGRIDRTGAHPIAEVLYNRSWDDILLVPSFQFPVSHSLAPMLFGEVYQLFF